MDDFWLNHKDILVILAHPDDPEFFCGGTIAKWTAHGHTVNYLLLTRGDKGINDHFDNVIDINLIREKEQRTAADCLGVNTIHYLDYRDGMLVPDLEMRKQIVVEIRSAKPHIVLTCDPTNYFMNGNYINHPDHRAAGQAVVDAVFPGAQNKLYFPSLLDLGHKPHRVEEVWLSLPKEPNLVIDVTEEWPQKVSALENHVSQVGEIPSFRERMERKGIPTDGGPLRYEEKFHRIIFK